MDDFDKYVEKRRNAMGVRRRCCVLRRRRRRVDVGGKVKDETIKGVHGFVVIEFERSIIKSRKVAAAGEER